MQSFIGQALNLRGLVDYQGDSVVSQEIVRKDKGTVTIFAFDKDQGLSEHTAPFDALIFVIDGKAEVKIASKVNTVKAGDFIIMPANKPHSVSAKERFKMVLVMIKA